MYYCCGSDAQTIFHLRQVIASNGKINFWSSVYSGVKVDPAKKRKVCVECLGDAESAKLRILERLRTDKPIVDEPLPIPPESTVTLDDSDQVSPVLITFNL